MIPQELINCKNWMYCNESSNAPADKNGKIVSRNDKNNHISWNEKTKIFILDNNYTAIDFDVCLDESGNIYSWAREFIDPFLNAGFYVEYSRSNRGLHVIAKGILQGNISIKMNQVHQKFKDLPPKSGIEIFVNHAITLTGNVYKNNMPVDIAGINDNFKLLYKYLAELKDRNTKKMNNYSNSNDLFNYVKSILSLNQVFGYYGIEYNTRKNINCPIPGHTDKKPSFHVDESKDLFYCFAGCGGGSVIDFVMKMENLNTLDASKWLIDRFHLEIEVDKNIKFYPHPVDKVVDIFEQINNFLSDSKKDEGVNCISENCILPKNIKSGFYMTDKGFVKRYAFNNKNDEGEEIKTYADKLIIPFKLYPTKIIFVDGAEEVEYNNKVFCENDTFSSISKFKTWVKSLGKFIWFDGDTKDLINLEKYISTYKKFSKLQTIKAVSKLGWTKENHFNPYTENEIFVKDDSIETKHLIESFNKFGDFDIWKDYIIKYSVNDTFRIYLNSSLAAPLVSLLKRPSFWVHNYAKHSTGKTPALYAAASIWANPEKYAPAFNATRVGLEFKLHTLGNLPCMLDDSQSLNEYTRKNIAGLIYDVANGSGKTRGNIAGELQKAKYWYTTMLTNGEQELLSGDEFEGAIKRLMEFNTIPFKDHSEAREARSIFLNNYGFTGREFIKLLVKYKCEINTLLIKIEDLINNSINYPTHIQNVATMALCDYMMNKYILGKEQKESFDSCIEWAKRILVLLPLEKDTDKITLGIAKVKNFIISNTHRFRTECPQGRVGFLRRGEAYFFPLEFKKLLQDWNIPESRFLKEIKPMEITITDDNGQFKLMKHNGQAMRPVGFYHEELTDLINELKDYS